jgi:hypothetical protein
MSSSVRTAGGRGSSALRKACWRKGFCASYAANKNDARLVLGPTHLAPTITGRHDRHLGGYTASSSAWARFPTLGRLTDRQQPADDKHSENSPVSTAAAVPACGICQNAHGFRNETCRAHSDLAVVERTTRVRLFCDPLSAECSSSRQRLGLASTLPVQSGPQRRPRPGGWASTGKAWRREPSRLRLVRVHSG